MNNLLEWVHADFSQLLFDTDIDGWEYISFLRCISCKPNLYILFLTNNDSLFGFYSKHPNSNLTMNNYTSDPSHFVFTLMKQGSQLIKKGSHTFNEMTWNYGICIHENGLININNSITLSFACDKVNNFVKKSLNNVYININSNDVNDKLFPDCFSLKRSIVIQMNYANTFCN
ncbi:TLDc domain-containing protein [Entamoeba marina]